MGRKRGSRSPTWKDISSHYASGYEDRRLAAGAGKLDYERSHDLMRRFLPAPPATILDVGGGTGVHACWLAGLGYTVHLVDIVPLHVEMARRASSAQPEAPLASVTVGDACSLAWDDGRFDGCLLFGPMYHLTDREDRLSALREVKRILKKDGVLIAVGISRFASALDGLRSGFLADPVFAGIVKRDLREGQHRNPIDKPEYFMDTFFHHPDELRREVEESGFDRVCVYGVEGPCWLATDFDAWWGDEELRERMLDISRKLEKEPSLLGISAHLIAVGRKK